MMRPAAKTPSMRGDADLAACRRRRAPRRTARRRRGATARRAPRSSSVVSTVASRGAGSCVSSARHALTTAEPHDAVPIEPPASAAVGRRCRRSPSRTCSGSTPSASAAICVSTVRAPVPMSAAAISTVKRAVGLAPRASPATGAGRPGRSTTATPVPTSQRPSRRAPGAGRGRPSRSARAPSRRHATRLRELNGMPVLGIDVGLVADRAARSGRCRTRRRARPSPTRARTCRGTRPARASTTASARRARRAGASCGGWAPRTSCASATAVCSANSLDASRSARTRRARSRASRPSRSAPSRTRWIVGVR